MIIIASSDILGRNLKYLRESRGLSLGEMAALIGMDDYRLEWLEQGVDFEIESDSLQKVYENFEGDMDHLFDKKFE